MAPPGTLLLLFFTLTTAIGFLLFPYGRGGNNDCEVGGGGVRELVSREHFPLDGDVVWVVQVSDLHLSAYHPERGEALRLQLASALRIVRPSLVLITGDITDAKKKVRTSSRQDETEWMQYRGIIDAIVKESGIEKSRFIDIRGNHDKYGVPFVSDKLDFFSTYSISSQLSRLGTIQSISFVGHDRRYIFVGIDDTMMAGVRAPSHLFGHPTDKMIEALESELHYWDSDPSLLVTKVVFGHFPLSFVASSESGKRYGTTFAKKSVSAYLCGHLHSKFSKQLWRKHTVELAFDSEQSNVKQFWEWELGDWKESRSMRILAIDRGMISFLDIVLSERSREQQYFETAVLITYPLDSRNMNLIESRSPRDDISALVFSTKQILNVTAKIFDSSKSFSLIEEVPLHLSNNSASYGSFFTSKWNNENYTSTYPTHYWLQVFVLDSFGNETASPARPISIEGKSAPIQITWLAYFIFHVQWEKLSLILIWGIIGFLTILLLLPKVVSCFTEKDALYQRWAISASISLPSWRRRVLFSMIWFFLEGSRNRILWYAMALYLLYLLKLPWFWGHATSENGEIAKMLMFGWKIESCNCSNMKRLLAFPDVMAIVIPFMYLIVTPLFLLIYSLHAEQSLFSLHNSKKLKCIKGHLESEESSYQATDGVLSESNRGMKSFLCKTCNGWRRTIIILACLLISMIHFMQTSILMSAYGVLPVALSPAFCLVPPLLLAAAVYSTRPPKCGGRGGH